MFNIKGGYKLKLQIPETKKLLGSIKKLVGKAKVTSLEVVKVVLV